MITIFCCQAFAEKNNKWSCEKSAQLQAFFWNIGKAKKVLKKTSSKSKSRKYLNKITEEGFDLLTSSKAPTCKSIKKEQVLKICSKGNKWVQKYMEEHESMIKSKLQDYMDLMKGFRKSLKKDKNKLKKELNKVNQKISKINSEDPEIEEAVRRIEKKEKEIKELLSEQQKRIQAGIEYVKSLQKLLEKAKKYHIPKEMINGPEVKRWKECKKMTSAIIYLQVLTNQYPELKRAAFSLMSLPIERLNHKVELSTLKINLSFAQIPKIKTK